jgi:hypothetical protein
MYEDKQVTAWDLDHNQGKFADLLAYYSEIFKFLCVVMFLIVAIEFFLIWCGKKGKMKPKTVNKLILFRRIVCIVIGKVGLVIVSFMGASTESGKF